MAAKCLITANVVSKDEIVSRNTNFPIGVVQLIEGRSEFHCEALIDRVCTHQATQIHHRRARGQGGTRRPETSLASNGLHLCLACHAAIESKREWAMTHGFIVRQREEPSEVPCWWRCAIDGNRKKKMVLLDVAGTMREVTHG